MKDPEKAIVRKKVTIMTFLDPLRLLAQKDVLLNLIFGGCIYAIWSMVTSSTTSLFKQNFGLDELVLGLAFLPNGESPARPIFLSQVTNPLKALVPSSDQELSDR